MERMTDVENAITRDRLRSAFSRYENRPADEHSAGTVKVVNADGSYEVLLDGGVQPRTCSAGCTAGVGDRVLVCIMANGRCVAVSRLEGEVAVISKPLNVEGDMNVSGSEAIDGNLSVDGWMAVHGNMRYSKPGMFYESPGKAGTAGYVKICTLVHVAAYRNAGMSLVIAQRGKRNSIIHVVFENHNGTDILGLKVFSVEGPANVYGVISGSRFDVYVQKSEAWDSVALVDAWSNNDGMGDWLDTSTGFAATLPSGYKTADKDLGSMKVLYNNSSGTSGTVTLSETAANFTYLEIYTKYSDSVCAGYSKVYSPNGNTVDVSSATALSGSGGTMRTRCKISGTSITQSYNYSATFYVSGSSGATSQNTHLITQVVGYK